jgi:hypothetical protein
LRLDVYELDELVELIDDHLEHPRFVDLLGVNTCSLFVAEGLRDGVDSIFQLADDAIDRFGEVNDVVLQFNCNFAV